MIILWYLTSGDTIQADAIDNGKLLHRATHRFPPTGSRALFWLTISAMSREVHDEVTACSS